MDAVEIKCKTLLTPSGIPGCDFAANPYVGCEHACVYCYAKFMKKFTAHDEPWGEFLDARVNAAEAAVKQLRSGAYSGKSVFVGSVTDAYQPAEKKYRLMRELLPVLGEFGASVSVLTKSGLVLRDADILSAMKNVSVGITITGIDERARRAFEPGAPPYAERLVALEQLTEKGISTYAFVGPILPGVTDRDFDMLLNSLRDTGVREIEFDALNYAKNNAAQLAAAAQAACPEAADAYRNNPAAAARKLRQKILDFNAATGIVCNIYF